MTRLAISLAIATLALFMWSAERTGAEAAALSVHDALGGVTFSQVATVSHRQIKRRKRTYGTGKRYLRRSNQRHYILDGRGLRYYGSGLYYLDPYPFYTQRCRFLADCPCRYLAGC
ncbi:MAG: hypothetical protein ACR2PM_09855 [Hyphomicrobiales bacterium]